MKPKFKCAIRTIATFKGKIEKLISLLPVLAASFSGGDLLQGKLAANLQNRWCDEERTLGNTEATFEDISREVNAWSQIDFLNGK